MQFENIHIQNLISHFRDFSIEGFNIFAKGDDHLPHLICVCPNRNFARAIQSLLIIAQCAMNLQAENSEITGNCCLTPMVLADGTVALVATVVNDAVWEDGSEVQHDGKQLQLGSSEYKDFAIGFLASEEQAVRPRDLTTPLYVYEDTLMPQENAEDEFPF